MELALSALSMLGVGGILLFFIQRYFSRRDKREAERAAAMEARMVKLDNALETIRLLAYARLSEETERLLTQGYATPQERHILNEMFLNYKAHGGMVTWTRASKKSTRSAPTTPNKKSRPSGRLFAVLCFFEIYGYVEAVIGAVAIVQLEAARYLVVADLVEAVNLCERLVQILPGNTAYLFPAEVHADRTLALIFKLTQYEIFLGRLLSLYLAQKRLPVAAIFIFESNTYHVEDLAVYRRTVCLALTKPLFALGGLSPPLCFTLGGLLLAFGLKQPRSLFDLVLLIEPVYKHADTYRVENDEKNDLPRLELFHVAASRAGFIQESSYTRSFGKGRLFDFVFLTSPCLWIFSRQDCSCRECRRQ
jgi:hypothetical protein